MPRRGRELEKDLLVVQLGVELEDELVDHALDDLGAEREEAHHRVETVPELGREEALDRLVPLVRV